MPVFRTGPLYFAELFVNFQRVLGGLAASGLGEAGLVLCEFMPWRRLDNYSFGRCQKHAKENFNTCRNCVKTRVLAFQKRGRKCVNFLQKMFAFQKFLLPLQPVN